MFCPQFAPLIGGAERQAEQLGKALVKRGIEVRVITPRLDKVSPSEEVLDGLELRRFPLHDLARAMPGTHGIGLINAPWIALQVMVRLWSEIGRVDIVHCHIGCLQSVVAAFAARLRGKVAICKAAMADERSDLGEMAKAGWANRLAAYLGRRVFTRWVATTHAVADALRRAGVRTEDIVVIPNGVAQVEKACHWRSRPVRRFLYLGRLSTNIQRDIPGLIRAFDSLAAHVPDAELALVGGGDLLIATRELVAKCSHADRIQVPGTGDAQSWLAWADCFVLPSRREGLSNALLEAMAMGLPCIANDIPPNREVLADGEAGILVPGGNVEALREQMARLTVNPPLLAERLSAASIARVAKNYTLTSVAACYDALYTAKSREVKA